MRAALAVPARLFGHLCRLGLAALFLYAGLIKSLDPVGFSEEVASYGIVSGSLATVLACAMIVVEVALGAALLLDYRHIESMAAAGVLMVVFIGAIGYAILTEQPLQSCGCFGRNVPRTPQQTLVEDLFFLAAAVAGGAALRWTDRRARAGLAGAGGAGARWKVAVVAATVLATGAFVLAAPYLPIDDYATAVAPGVRWGDLGVALAEIRLEEGTHLVAILAMNDVESRESLPALNALASGGESPVVALSADDEQAIFEFKFAQGPVFPIHHVAPTDLRRMHRALPRYFLLKDGVVSRTWQRVPDAEQVGAALREAGGAA